MKLQLVAAALLAVATCNTTLPTGHFEYFEEWKVDFDRSYSSASEEAHRKDIWLKNHRLVMEHNTLADQGNKSYRLGMTKFADLENEEYRLLVAHGCFNSSNASLPRQGSPFQTLPEGFSLPSTVDWRTKGYVTRVKDQLQCDSCWAFSATGSLEGQHFKKTGKLVSLSEQQLVDCSGTHGNKGCSGGRMDYAFNYIKAVGGSNIEASYPYKAKDGKCTFATATIGATITGHIDMPSGDEDALKQAVATVGPVSVAIDSSHVSFQLYKSGVYDEPSCSSTNLDHAMLAVGYGTDSGLDYWLVKNSQGVGWGEQGYIKMSRNKHNQCGIATVASYPLV